MRIRNERHALEKLRQAADLVRSLETYCLREEPASRKLRKAYDCLASVIHDPGEAFRDIEC
jgi:hypothetical protein